MSRPGRTRKRSRAVREAIRANKEALEGRMAVLSDLLIKAKPAAPNPAVFREALSEQASLILRAAKQHRREATATINPATKSIYVIGGDYGAVKIGIARDVKARLATLQTGNPRPLKIFYKRVVRNAREVERVCHAELTTHRRVGEWFSVAPDEAVSVVRAVADDFEARRKAILAAQAA